MMRYFSRLTLLNQIVFGNSMIIIIGAIAGTILTRHLTDQAADISLILLFSTLGTTLTIAINYWLIKSALRPLRDLNKAVEKVRDREVYHPPDLAKDAPPDMVQLTSGVNELLLRLAEHNRQLRLLSQRAINAHEEERKRIAQSLHDDTGQALTMLIIHLERLENQHSQAQPALRDKLAIVRQLASDTLGELRKIIQGLRPSMLDDLGLVPAIRWYARSCLEEAGIKVDIDATEIDEPLSLDVRITLFRIAQEAINNIVRHSKARGATIKLVQQANSITLRITDDGHGFDTDQISAEAIQKQRWGLVGIIERAELVGGKVQLASQPGHGTTIEVTMPWSSSMEDRHV